MSSNALVVLGAGKGTRMKSELPKVLHEIGGAPMLAHALQAGSALSPERVVVVAGHGAEAVARETARFAPDAAIALQTEQLGTGHAVLQARDALRGFSGDVVVLYGDTPFVSEETLQKMVEARQRAAVVVLGFEAADPARYGRLVMQGDSLERIVEFKDATEAERAITFCNSGLVACDADLLFDLLEQVGNDNAAGEYYLPDIVALARGRGLAVTAVACDESETLGVNSRADLAAAEAVFQARARADLLANGVTMMAPDTVYLSLDTVIGRDTVIEPNVVFGRGVTVESGARLRAFSHFEGCHVSRGATIGPFARLRPGAELGEDTHVGNFVEIKNAVIDQGAKINHLSYVGDAEIGARTNIGAGTITCNYDGVMKHRTKIGSDTFIGSNTMLVAPVTVGDRAMTATATTVTEDVPDEALAIGRVRQATKNGRAVKLVEYLRSRKARLLDRE